MNTSSLRILIAEDDIDVADLLALMLEDRGCKITTAENGQTAIAILEERSFDLLICDLWMPKIDGPAVLDWCQLHRPELPIAVLTAQREIGVDISTRPNVRACLFKPFSLQDQDRFEKLIETLRVEDDA